MKWLIVDVNAAVGLLHDVDMGDVGVSGVHPTSIFMV
jgi:hypothetical protein